MLKGPETRGGPVAALDRPDGGAGLVLCAACTTTGMMPRTPCDRGRGLRTGADTLGVPKHTRGR
jgi:hypothetical protein